MSDSVRKLNNTELEQVGGGMGIGHGGDPVAEGPLPIGSPYGGLDPLGSPKGPIPLGGDWWKPVPGKP